MKIPKKIRIGSVDYKVKFTNKTIVLNAREAYATIDFDHHLIKINSNLADLQHQEGSFLHELFHGIIRERNLDIKDEEHVVEELARGLHQVLRDNPEIFK